MNFEMPTPVSYTHLDVYKRQIMDRYTEALIREIRSCGRMRGERRLRSFYMGGGTPTALTPDQLERVLYAVQEAFGFENMTEVTVEAGRPDTIDKAHLQVLQQYGICLLYTSGRMAECTGSNLLIRGWSPG